MTKIFLAVMMLSVCACPVIPSTQTDSGTQSNESDGGQNIADAGVLKNTCIAPSTIALANARVPTGYCAWTFASGLLQPRGIAVASNGDLLVVERGTGKVTVLWDDDNDGLSAPSERATLAQSGGGDNLNHGILITQGFLYASTVTRVLRWPYTAGTRTSLGAPQIVITGMPTGGHNTRTLAQDSTGNLYVTVGSGSNVDANSNRSRIRRFTPTQVQTGSIDFQTGEVFADGLRNEVGLAFDSMGRLWGVENGRDTLSRNDLGGDIHEDNPGEELNLFAEAGKFYGYPYCFSEFSLPSGIGGGPTTQWADPTFINDGTHGDAWCKNANNVVAPKLVMPAHTAPLDMTFYSGGSFPLSDVGSVFVSLHGSWNRSTPIGYEVGRIVFQNGNAVRYETVLEYDNNAATGAQWPHRPVGVKMGIDGRLFVSSDDTGVIIAIGYQR